MRKRAPQNGDLLRSRLSGACEQLLGRAVDVAVPATEGDFAAARPTTGAFGTPIFAVTLLIGLIRKAFGKSTREFERRIVSYRVLAVSSGQLHEYISDKRSEHVGALVATTPITEMSFERRNSFYVRLCAGARKYWLTTEQAAALAAAVHATIAPWTGRSRY